MVGVSAAGAELEVETLVLGEAVLSYSPATHHSWGVEPSMGDPFEEATVRVNQSRIRGAGQGLFVTRHVRLHCLDCIINITTY